MAIRDFHASLVRDINCPMARACFLDAASRHEVLRPHAALSDAVEIFRGDPDHNMPERDALTRAFIEEARRRHTSTWNSALMLAYWGMLTNVRRGLIPWEQTGDDLDQMTLLAFLDTAHDPEFDASLDRLLMHLNTGTWRRLEALKVTKSKRGRRKRARQQEAMVNLAAMAAIRPQLATLRRAEPANAPPDTELVHSRILRVFRDKQVKAHRVDCLMSTVGGEELLTAYVARLHPDLSKEERTPIENRYKTDRGRLLALLKQNAPELELGLSVHHMRTERCAI